jgi:hypothetical protein
MQISRIRLSDKTSRLCFRVQRHLQFLNPSRSLFGLVRYRGATSNGRPIDLDQCAVLRPVIFCNLGKEGDGA